MQAREQQHEGLSVLEIEGDIDLACFAGLARVSCSAFAKKRVCRCWCWISKRWRSTWISSGLATLVEYVRIAEPHGGKFGLIHVSDRVRTIFDLVRLSEFLPIYPSLEEARAALSAPPGA